MLFHSSACDFFMNVTLHRMSSTVSTSTSCYGIVPSIDKNTYGINIARKSVSFCGYQKDSFVNEVHEMNCHHS